MSSQGEKSLPSGSCLGVTSPEHERAQRFPNRQMSPVFTKDIRRVGSANNVMKAGDAIASLVRWCEKALWHLCSLEWGRVAVLTTDSLSPTQKTGHQEEPPNSAGLDTDLGSAQLQCERPHARNQKQQFQRWSATWNANQWESC